MSHMISTPPPAQGNLYAPPQARVDDIPPDSGAEFAARSTRFFATLIDVATPAVIGIIAAIVIPMAQKHTSVLYAGIFLMFAFGLAVIVINCILLHRNGQTIGKRLLGIKTVRSDGSRIGLTRIFFLRYLPVTILSAIPYIGTLIGLADSLLIFRNSNQCLHDNIADTIVVKV